MKYAEAAIFSRRYGWGVAKKFEDWGITDLKRRVGTFAGGRRGRVSTPLHAMLS